MPDKLTCAIDYRGRKFSLPFGLAPPLSKESLATYLGDLQASCIFYSFVKDEEKYYRPDSASDFSFRGLSLAGESEMVVPLSMRNDEAHLAEPFELDPSVFEPSWKSVAVNAGEPADAIARRVGAKLRWDADSRQASPLPLPVFTDESLLIFWPEVEAAQGGLHQTKGVLEGDGGDPQYLLSTSADKRDGELDRLLLRSPAVARVRFERYRHIVRTGEKAQLNCPSAAGRLLLKTLPTGVTPDSTASQLATTPPLTAGRLLVFENVLAGSVAQFILPLLVYQLKNFDALKSERLFKPALTAQFKWLLGTWLAYLKQIRPASAPDPSNPNPSLPADLTGPFRPGRNADAKQISSLLGYVLAHEDAKASVTYYLKHFYAPVLGGVTWEELGVAIPAAPDREPRKSDPETHGLLEHLPGASETWLLCYAGCPLGHPAPIYLPPAADPPEAETLLQSYFTTFDLEALHLGGRTGAIYAGSTPTKNQSVLRPPDLSQFAEWSGGRFAALRLVDPEWPSKQACTIYDWLGEMVKDPHPKEEVGPPVDFRDYAAAGHPLAAALGWQTFTKAQSVRTAMTTLRNYGPSTEEESWLGAQIAAWWGKKTKLTEGGKWPHPEGKAPIRPGPYNPFKTQWITTRYDEDGIGIETTCGYDAFDLEAVFKAREVVRDGKSFKADVHPALFLAVADQEGYRSVRGVRYDRRQEVITYSPGCAFPKEIRDDPEAGEQFARIVWLAWPFGLDILTNRSKKEFKGQATYLSEDEQLFDDRLRMLTNKGDSSRAVLDPDAMPPVYVKWFLKKRFLAEFSGPKNTAQEEVLMRRPSRRIQWVALSLQQAYMQWLHFALHVAETKGAGEEWAAEVVNEFVAGPAPTPGTNANSIQRRDYIAYYSLLYLAFHAGLPTWNGLVQKAKGLLSSGKAKSPTVSLYMLLERTRDPAMSDKDLRQWANMMRFAVALDAYLRIDYTTFKINATDPEGRTW
jgi:hypothetical protein